MTKADEIRVFLAVPVGDELRAQLTDMEMEADLPEMPLRRMADEDRHLTLQFLGNTKMSDLDHVRETTKQIAARHNTFSIKIVEVSWFPSEKRPLVISANTENDEQLSQLAKELGEALDLPTFKAPTRPFRGHITLLKVPNRHRKPQKPFQIRFEGRLRVNSIALYQSILSPEGSRYIPLWEEKLKEL